MLGMKPLDLATAHAATHCAVVSSDIAARLPFREVCDPSHRSAPGRVFRFADFSQALLKAHAGKAVICSTPERGYNLLTIFLCAHFVPPFLIFQ
jgi:hypothetical protein